MEENFMKNNVDVKKQFDSCWANRTTKRKAFSFQYSIKDKDYKVQIKSTKRDTPDSIFKKFMESIAPQGVQIPNDIKIVQILGVL